MSCLEDVSQNYARGGSGGPASGDLEGEEADQVSAEGSRVSEGFLFFGLAPTRFTEVWFVQK